MAEFGFWEEMIITVKTRAVVLISASCGKNIYTIHTETDHCNSS
jgi:hypothetical protein